MRYRWEYEAGEEGPQVFNCKLGGKGYFVGRPTRWGNPFTVGRDGNRREVIDKFKTWIVTQPELMAALPELQGLNLMCYCAPLPCHADVLLELANPLPTPENGARALGES